MQPIDSQTDRCVTRPQHVQVLTATNLEVENKGVLFSTSLGGVWTCINGYSRSTAWWQIFFITNGRKVVHSNGRKVVYSKWQKRLLQTPSWPSTPDPPGLALAFGGARVFTPREGSLPQSFPHTFKVAVCSAASHCTQGMLEQAGASSEWFDHHFCATALFLPSSILTPRSFFCRHLPSVLW